MVVIYWSIVKKDGRKGVNTKDKIGRLVQGHSVKAMVKKLLYTKISSWIARNYVKTISTYDEVVKSPSRRDIKNAKGC